MLNNVPKGVSRATRMVTLRHPNAMTGTLWQKHIHRTADSAPDTFGGLPTLGGMGVLDTEDEANYTYARLADVKIVFTGRYLAGQDNMIDTGNGLNYPAAAREALIECLIEPGTPGWMQPEKSQVVSCHPGNGVVVTYQIVGVSGNLEIPPYTRKYLLNPLNDSTQWPVDQDDSIPPVEPSGSVWAGIQW